MNSRATILALVGLTLGLTLLVNNLFANWGKITIHADRKPLRDIVRSIERQGGVKILSTLDPEKRVTLHLTRASVAEALDMLKIRADADIELAYFLAPKKMGTKQLRLDVTAGNRAAYERTRFGSPLIGGFISDTPIDPRRMTWTPQPTSQADLANYLRQAAIEIDATFFRPKDWNPSITQVPSKGLASKSITSLANAADAAMEEYFLLSESRRGWGRDRPQQREGGAATGEWRGGFIDLNNPETVAALERRIENQIALLPEEERQQARDDLERLKQLQVELAGLNPLQRMEKFRELMSNPEIQQRIEERMSNRDMRSAPEQRRDRYERRVERKFERKFGARQ